MTRTLDTYSRAVPGLDAEAAACIGALLGAERERLGQPADAGR